MTSDHRGSSRGTQQLILTVSSDVRDLIQVLTEFQKLSIHPKHVESRVSRVKETETKEETEGKMDYFIEFMSPSSEVTASLLTNLGRVTPDIKSLGVPEGEGEGRPWFPRHISDLHQCCTNLLKYGEELTPDHPGYGDEEYVKRRKVIAEISSNYRYGDVIPHVEYTKLETRTWEEMFRKLNLLYPTHACKEFNAHRHQLFSSCNYREDNIPQLEDVSRYLQGKTGWQLWPVIGWISARDFLNSLAFRVFPTSQYIRHHSSPTYTPEPDICHELMGHAPLFCDPYYAQFSQDIGMASLGISDKWIKKLETLYWFTVEFGMVREADGPKACGAGILSGCQELEYSCTDVPKREEFDIEIAMATSFPQTGLQPLYFVASSIADMGERLIEYSRSIPKDFELTYDPQMQRIRMKHIIKE